MFLTQLISCPKRNFFSAPQNVAYNMNYRSLLMYNCLNFNLNCYNHLQRKLVSGLKILLLIEPKHLESRLIINTLWRDNHIVKI